jgi:hypothetical protein
MEEIIDYGFDNIVIPKAEFLAKFNPNTGELLSVGPSVAFTGQDNILPVDYEMAMSIIEGKISLHSCIVNIEGGCIEISQVKSLFKIDDVLHRISKKNYREVENIDILLLCSKNKKSIKISLSENLGGTYKSNLDSNSKKNKKMQWNGETSMHFYITEYNDPNVLYQRFELTLDELKLNDVVINFSKKLPNTFSVYTRRLFKNYILDHENN